MILTQEPESWKQYSRSLPDGYTVITEKEALDPKNREVLTTARSFINRNVRAGAPIGHQEFKTINGRKILFVVEPHFHEPNGPVKPWGWHHGATVFVPPVNDYWSFLYDDSSAFGAEAILKGKDLKTRLKRFAVPAALTVLTVLNPPVGLTVSLGTLAFNHFHNKQTPFKGVPVASDIHDSAPLPV